MKCGQNCATAVFIIVIIMIGYVWFMGVFHEPPPVANKQIVIAPSAETESIITPKVSVPIRRSLGIFTVTAYCPCSKCCGEYSDRITASGKPAEGKLIAADRVFPFGLLLDVPGYGERVPVEDRGEAIKNRHIDLLFPNHNEALVWGKQYLEIHGWFYLGVK